MKIHVTLFISFLFSIGFAQEQFKFRRFTTDDGLPTNSIYAITEDRKGNLVLGTDNGLTFFDGTDFKTLNVKDGLINPYIVGLTNDEKGNIWFINYGGKLQKIVNNKISTTNVFTEYYNQITNTNNKIYLFTSQRWNKNKQYTSIGISKYNNFRIDTDTLNRNPKIAPQILSQNNEIIELHNNTLHYKKNVIALPKEVKFIHKVIFRNKVVYILEDTKLYILDHKSVLIHTIKLPQSLSANRFNKYDFIVDPQENCWLSIQGKGLFLLKNNKWISVQESLGLSSNDNINFLYCDKKGRLWIATNEKGLFCIPTVFIQNIRFNNVENNFNSFATSADQKSLFIATNFKLYSYEKDQIHFLEESLLPIKIDNLGSTPIYYFPYHQNLPQDKKLKILTKTSGRQVIKKNGSKYYSIFNLSSLITANDNDSKELLIENKVPKKEKIRNIVYHKNEYYFNNYHKINIRTFDDKNIYEKRELKFKIKGFIEDFTFINDTMWVAASDVVYKIFNEKIIDSITSVNTIKLEDVRRIKPIGNDVYLCSRIGLFKIGKMGNRVLNKYNFLPSNDVFNVIVFDKELFVGTIEGLGKIKKAIVDAKSNNPKLEIYYKGIPATTINIGTTVSEIDLQLKIQNYYDPRNQFIQYKINNLSWTASTNKDITIPVLNFGTYRVSIRVKDVNSDWTTQNITINRAYPYYMKWPFITVLVLLLSGIIYLLYRNQTQKIKKEKRKEIAINNTIVELRQNALSAMMNPHFLFNSLNAIQYFINSNQKEKSSDYLGKLARLVRLFLSHSSEPFITLDNEIKRLKLYLELEQVRFNNFTYQIHVDTKIDVIKTKIPNMIVQPFIENAILHGISQLKQNDGTIDLHFILENELLIIEILDNGFGLEDKKQKTDHISKGIQITSERLEILQNSYPKKTFALKQESAYPNTIRKGHKVTIQLTILTQ